MGKALNFFKNIKNFGKKLIGGIGKGLGVAGKVMNTIAPVVNTVGALIPGKGTAVAAGFNMVNDLVNKGNELIGNVNNDSGGEQKYRAVNIAEGVNTSNVGNFLRDKINQTMSKLKQPFGVTPPDSNSQPEMKEENKTSSNFGVVGGKVLQNAPSFLKNILN